MAEPRAINANKFRRLIKEATKLGFDELYLTGGEPFLHPKIFHLLDYSVPRIKTTILTNATILTPHRLERISGFSPENLNFQVSFDSANPSLNDFYRGLNSWKRTMDGVKQLLQLGFQPKLGGTATPATEENEQEFTNFFLEQGFAQSDIFLRPLIQGGFSREGKKLSRGNLLPEICIDDEGVYWHPLSTDPNFLVTRKLFPFNGTIELFRKEMFRREQGGIKSLPYQ
jgi:MoaA/NifB/PqqE/SkfB family radical SAM enzyme